MDGYINPDPTPGPETQAFWDAAREGRFLVKTCTACDRAHWYPRNICPFCSSSDTVWKDASGRGTIYSFSPLRRMPKPYIIAYVTLEEGPTMMTNIVDADPADLSIGMPVQLKFSRTESDFRVPTFTLSAGPATA
ncbi:DNA-binding protein [Primorskyibacter flagellatus]|uniref:DNA-binding protein n=1 Tax=Primorskyibacter flagellatus TaxID=1387277 RepID=A0A917AGU5_9RHOB|nr:Zn-ribbon domain-containing OB-fold protein [Primorskyibacter flagellatus]GGE50011.1 DNA-binding protein [Primorskyibacter flagellatus]